MGNLSSRESVLKAVAEFDRLGRDQFLSKYRFGRSTRYLLVVAGKHYDSKAIVGAAHGFENPSVGPLDRSSFSGGIASGAAAWQLQRLGFEIVDRPER